MVRQPKFPDAGVGHNCFTKMTVEIALVDVTLGDWHS